MKSIATAILILCVATSPVAAADSIGLYVNQGRQMGTGTESTRFLDLSQFYPFDIDVYVEVSNQLGGIEFVMDDLVYTVPGVFRLRAERLDQYYSYYPLDVGDSEHGEYIITWSRCDRSGHLRVLQVEYLDLNGLIGPDTVVGVRGLQEGGTQPSRFDGRPGYVDCDGVLRELVPEPWSELGMPDRGDLAGAAVLNPTWMPIPVTGASLSALKARY